ncbi:MAG TPA: hypothetical protein VNL39_04965 [Xanthobacteraceae bacterium]|nr:hypothetical protein [Xanthobacteraceae bacterium]
MSRLRAGDWVEVRSKDEILRTLDERGRLDGLPFMPQMFQYCGKRFKVYKRAHKTCDTVSNVPDFPGRSLPDGVHLNLRCDGKAYDGCQAACLIFWKEQWLKPVSGPAVDGEPSPRTAPDNSDTPAQPPRCTEEDVIRATRAPRRKPDEEVIYTCQATQLLEYTRPLPWWDARQYLEDYLSRNASLWRILRGTIYICYYYGALCNKQKLGRLGRWLYDRFQSLWGGPPFPRYRGKLPPGERGPVATLNLQPGELVRIKPYEEILQTINSENKNRGMGFDGELVPYCGQTFRVRSRVERFVDEKTGKMKTLKTPAVILENVFCQARYSHHRMFCPRSIYAWWREAWLERVPDPEQGLNTGDDQGSQANSKPIQGDRNNQLSSRDQQKVAIGQ